MSMWESATLLLAEGENPFGMIWPMILMIGFLYYFIIVRGNRRERGKRDSLLNSLKKNDRVVTIGGIIGTISGTSQDGREVTLKIDDNTKIKMLRTAIKGPLREADADAPGEKLKDDDATAK